MPKDYIQVIEGLYNSDPQREWERLERHRTEYAVTLKVLADHLPRTPARILDCGGGPGRYAIALSKQGYDVTLFDLSPALLDIARQKSMETGITLSGIEHGSATDLSRFEDNSFDAVLLMGPLYHLLTEENRRLVLEQAYRVAKPGAPVFAAFINRYAAHRDGATFYPHLYRDNQREYEGILEHGRTFPMEGKQNFVAYFAHPDEIEPLCRSAGFDVLDLVGVEGLASMHEDKLNELEGDLWNAWVEVNYTVGRDRCAIGGTEHSLAVCRKPRWHQALFDVCTYLNDLACDYHIVGGTTLALHGLPIPVKDIDIEMPLTAAQQFAEAYADHCTLPLEYRESDHIRSYWGSFDIKGINFDIMSELEFCVNGQWEISYCQHGLEMVFRGQTVKVNTLEEETLAYIRRGRLDRASLALKHCDATILNRLLREYPGK